MIFELEAPVKISDQSYTVQINTQHTIEIAYPSRESGAHTTPPDTAEPFQQFFQALAPVYEAYSKRWFHTPMPPMGFLRRLSHMWLFDSHRPYSGPVPDENQPAILVRQVWRPDKLQILPRVIQLHWTLVRASYEVEQPSGFSGGGEGATAYADPISTDAIPMVLNETAPAANLSMSSLRARALRKVREARMRAAAAKWRADTLIARYYDKYGTTELMDGDSILSSDEDGESAVPKAR